MSDEIVGDEIPAPILILIGVKNVTEATKIVNNQFSRIKSFSILTHVTSDRDFIMSSCPSNLIFCNEMPFMSDLILPFGGLGKYLFDEFTMKRFQYIRRRNFLIDSILWIINHQPLDIMRTSLINFFVKPRRRIVFHYLPQVCFCMGFTTAFLIRFNSYLWLIYKWITIVKRMDLMKRLPSGDDLRTTSRKFIGDLTKPGKDLDTSSLVEISSD